MGGRDTVRGLSAWLVTIAYKRKLQQDNGKDFLVLNKEESEALMCILEDGTILLDKLLDERNYL